MSQIMLLSKKICEKVLNMDIKTVSASTEDIVSAIKEALSDEHKMICKTVNSPYGDGNSAKMITQKIIDTVLGSKIDLKKKFYDIR